MRLECVSCEFDRCRPRLLAQRLLPGIDNAFLNYENEPFVDQGKFVLNQPSRIGFLPDPLVFVCSDCGRLVEFGDVEDLHRRWQQAKDQKIVQNRIPVVTTGDR
jgi:hypothetical protein